MNRTCRASLSAASVAVVAVAIGAIVGTGTPACDDGHFGCVDDIECQDVVVNGQQFDLCAPSGACVACLDTPDCPIDQACCQGECVTEEALEDFCGCKSAHDPDGDIGELCEGQSPACLRRGRLADVDELGQARCGCPCSAELGGTLCVVLEDEDDISCTCDPARPEETCHQPVLGGDDRPHRPADTCTSLNTCVCAAIAEPCGRSEDCLEVGCVDLLDDGDNCGVAGRVCGTAETGIEGDDACVEGGCACDDDGDCQASDLNVNECGDEGFCVCDDYVLDGEDAPCPLGARCIGGGCRLGEVTYSDEEQLLEAVFESANEGAGG